MDALALAHHVGILHHSLPENGVVVIARFICGGLGAACIVFALYFWRLLGWDRALIYVLVGLLAVLQETDALQRHAPLVFWRLPLIAVLLVACLVSIRHYLTGRHLPVRRSRD